MVQMTAGYPHRRAHQSSPITKRASQSASLVVKDSEKLGLPLIVRTPKGPAGPEELIVAWSGEGVVDSQS